MTLKESSIIAGISFLALNVAGGPVAEAREAKQVGAKLVAEFHHDTSKALREVPPIQRERREYLDKRANKGPKPFRTAGSAGVAQRDGAVQASVAPLVPVSSGISFDGVGIPNYDVRYAPPDTNGSVGRTISGVGYYVQWVNVSFGIFNKATGAMVYGPANGNTLWSGFGGQCESSNDGDPIVLYDKLADRWVFMQFAVSAQPYLQCVAVSKTSDPLGQYSRYAFSYGTSFNDYPKVGVWPDAYYVTYNMFANGQTFAGGEVCAMDRTAMLNGTAATQQCFLKSNDGGLLPADFDGTILPAAGSPNYVLSFGTNSLNFYKFHVDWSNPANSTLTGPTVLPVASFTEACNTATRGACVVQPSTQNKLESLGDRLMYRLAYRKFADGHEALVTNHSVKVGTQRKNPYTGIRWYELRGLSGTPTVHQQGTFTNGDTSFRWMGSGAMDKQGNVAIGYSVSSGSVRPSIRFTGRAASDPLGTMGAETSLLTGAGSQTGSLHRWGDYSSISVDPDDDCTFWFTTEYLKTTGSFNWSTRVGSFRLNNCQ